MGGNPFVPTQKWEGLQRSELVNKSTKLGSNITKGSILIKKFSTLVPPWTN